jgi:hypothetical protein
VEPVQIKLLRPINFRIVGTILDVPDGVAELWILQRKAARVVPPAAAEPLVPVEGRQQRMVPQSRKLEKMVRR